MRLRRLVVGMRRQAGIVHRRELPAGWRTTRRPRPPVAFWRCHPHRQRLHARARSARRPCGSSAWPHTCISRRTSSMTDSVPATAPAITSLWPLRYLVALWITTSAPCSSGRKLIGEAKVESTISASPSALAQGGERLEVQHAQQRDWSASRRRSPRVVLRSALLPVARLERVDEASPRCRGGRTPRVNRRRTPP